MANSFDFDNNEVFISKELLEIYNEIPQYSLPQVLEKLNISQLNLRKYLLQIGCKTYSEFKEEISFEKAVRFEQFLQRYENFNQDKIISIMESLKEGKIDMAQMEDICHLIHNSERLIVYGSPTLLNLFFDFQVDMKIFGKTVLMSSVNEGKMIIPKENDCVVICSATKRLLACCGAVFKKIVLEAPNKKIFMTKDKVVDEKMDYCLSTDTDNDYYEMHYMFLLYLDLIKTRYYELYIAGGTL
jgi:hypothetical protein